MRTAGLSVRGNGAANGGRQVDETVKAATKVFVAGPFTPAVVDGKQFDETCRVRIQKIISVVQDMGVPLFSSHIVERWGHNLEVPRVLARRDLNEMLTASHVVAYAGPIVSAGVFMELGCAVTHGHPVLVIRDGEIRSDFFRGLVDCGLIIEAEWSNDVEVERRIRQFVARASGDAALVNAADGMVR